MRRSFLFLSPVLAMLPSTDANAQVSPARELPKVGKTVRQAPIVTAPVSDRLVRPDPASRPQVVVVLQLPHDFKFNDHSRPGWTMSTLPLPGEGFGRPGAISRLFTRGRSSERCPGAGYFEFSVPNLGKHGFENDVHGTFSNYRAYTGPGFSRGADFVGRNGMQVSARYSHDKTWPHRIFSIWYPIGEKETKVLQHTMYECSGGFSVPIHVVGPKDINPLTGRPIRHLPVN